MRAFMASFMPESALSIVYIQEPDVSEALDLELRSLLSVSFPQPSNAFFRERRYAHDVPRHRYLIRDLQDRLVAHLGVHDKVLGVGATELAVGGMAEVCVHESQRGQGLVKRLLQRAHADLAERGIGFAFLFGEPQIYGSSGYRHVAADVRRWDAATQAFITGPSRVALCKPLGAALWPDGVVDLRGSMF